ncbi:MAG: hypothetical protein SFU98_06560 [Leptospiraceae bacterium]|nr:hypothetical protein [Leptospiraceae bacterium]
MKFCLVLILTVTSAFGRPIESDFTLDLNHDYEYEKGGLKTKFSDWVPYKLHKWNPKFLEDFYELYALDLHHKEDDLKKNIYFLKVGLASKFRHPRNALCEIKSEEQYYKYRLLVTMHMNLQIMRSYMRIASLYDKRHLYFQNLDFAHELKNSFAIAKTNYKEALPFWKQAKEDAFKANKLKKELDLGTLESESFEIVKGKLNFEVIIADHLERLEKKQLAVEKYLKENPAADKPLLEIGEEETKP